MGVGVGELASIEGWYLIKSHCDSVVWFQSEQKFNNNKNDYTRLG